MVRIAIAVGILFAAALGGAPAGKAEAKPLEVSQGEIVELKVSGSGLAAVEGRLDQQLIRFYADGRGTFAALVGIDLEAKPGLAKVLVKGRKRGGGYRETQIVLRIKAKAFDEEAFSVQPEFDQFSAEVLERVRHEQERLTGIFAQSTGERFWESPFILPVHAGISSPFGYRRVINGTPRAPHTGVDLKAPLGTEVVAANHGRVALVDELFFSGNSVVLDHGAGLYTVYFHLSEVKVHQGDKVRRGEVIGLSGMTGRVTGPHLHWGARLNGARVDPFGLIKNFAGGADERLPWDGAAKKAEP